MRADVSLKLMGPDLTYTLVRPLVLKYLKIQQRRKYVCHFLLSNNTDTLLAGRQHGNRSALLLPGCPLRNPRHTDIQDER